jgi:hypothetical protein
MHFAWLQTSSSPKRPLKLTFQAAIKNSPKTHR